MSQVSSIKKVATGFILFRRLSKEVQYLMLQASYGEFHWSPPKGHVEPGETEIQTAFRETEEETGIPKDEIIYHEKFSAELRYNVNGKPKRVVYWLGELKDPKFTVKLSDEHKDFKWLSFKDAWEIAQYEDMRKSLTAANEFIDSL
ncbi:nudix (nucleoside diphosphate linked moiety X)-type motif 2 [Mactra antiquata]